MNDECNHSLIATEIEPPHHAFNPRVKCYGLIWEPLRGPVPKGTRRIESATERHPLVELLVAKLRLARASSADHCAKGCTLTLTADEIDSLSRVYEYIPKTVGGTVVRVVDEYYITKERGCR